MAVNIVRLPGPASTDSIGAMLAAKNQRDYGGVDAFNRMAEAVFISNDRDKDRQIERMALVARLLADQEGNAIGREQIAEQARQFNQSIASQEDRFTRELQASREESKAERELTGRQIATLEGQLSELKSQNAFDRKSSSASALLDQSAAAVQASFTVIDQAAELAGMEVKDRIEGVQRSMQQSLHSDFAPISREIALLAASIPEGDDDKRTAAIGQIDTQVAGFERMFRDRLADTNAKPESRAAAVVAANNYVQEILGEIGKLHPTASKADKKKLESMQDKMLDVARTAVRATGVIEELDRALSIDDATKAVAREKIKRTQELARAATAFRNDVINATTQEGAALPQRGLDTSTFANPMEVPTVDLAGVSKALEALAKPAPASAPTTSGFAVPDAKAAVAAQKMQERVAQGQPAAVPSAIGNLRPDKVVGFVGEALNQMTKPAPPSPNVQAANQQGILTMQNLLAQPGDNVNLIRPDGGIVVVKKSALTPEFLAELRAKGFKVPGLDGG